MLNDRRLAGFKIACAPDQLVKLAVNVVLSNLEALQVFGSDSTASVMVRFSCAVSVAKRFSHAAQGPCRLAKWPGRRRPGRPAGSGADLHQLAHFTFPPLFLVGAGERE